MPAGCPTCSIPCTSTCKERFISSEQAGVARHMLTGSTITCHLGDGREVGFGEAQAPEQAAPCISVPGAAMMAAGRHGKALQPRPLLWLLACMS